MSLWSAPSLETPSVISEFTADDEPDNVENPSLTSQDNGEGEDIYVAETENLGNNAFQEACLG